jgi:hypothetical protein
VSSNSLAEQANPSKRPCVEIKTEKLEFEPNSSSQIAQPTMNETSGESSMDPNVRNYMCMRIQEIAANQGRMDSYLHSLFLDNFGELDDLGFDPDELGKVIEAFEKFTERGRDDEEDEDTDTSMTA